MPYSDKQEKKQHNALYYQNNRDRIENAKDRQKIRAYDRANYHKYRLANLQRKRLVREPLYNFIDDYKSRPCAECGHIFAAIAMDFDHVRGEKIMSISSMVSKNLPFAQIWAEIEKCEVVCACCHRVRTERRLHQAP